eukprot:6494811-Prymnesium_polylepis.2
MHHYRHTIASTWRHRVHSTRRTEGFVKRREVAQILYTHALHAFMVGHPQSDDSRPLLLSWTYSAACGPSSNRNCDGTDRTCWREERSSSAATARQPERKGST